MSKELEELSKDTKISYIKKAGVDHNTRMKRTDKNVKYDKNHDQQGTDIRKMDNREKGIDKAFKKLTKESAQLVKSISEKNHLKSKQIFEYIFSEKIADTLDALTESIAQTIGEAAKQCDCEDKDKCKCAAGAPEGFDGTNNASGDDGVSESKLEEMFDGLTESMRAELAEEMGVPLAELDKKTLGSYVKKAMDHKSTSDFLHGQYRVGGKQPKNDMGDYYKKKSQKREKGISKAVDKLAK